MHQSNINIQVTLDENKIPNTIEWSATDSANATPAEAKAFILSFWDGAERNALRIDLWTKKMMVDEMNDFFFQTMMTMADSFHRATGNAELTEEFKTFSQSFYKKAQEALQQNNKLS